MNHLRLMALLFFGSCSFLNAKVDLHFTNSKITAHLLMLINGMEAPESSQAYVTYLQNNIAKDHTFWSLTQRLNKFDWNKKVLYFTDVPRDLSIDYTDVKDRLYKLSIIAKDYETFYFLISGLLSFKEHQELKNCFEKSRDIFEKIYWNPYENLNNAYIKRFKTYEASLQKWVSKMALFYNNTDDTPHYINIFTIPGDGRSSKAFAPRGNISIVGVNEDTKDFEGFLGVVLHEIAHELDHGRNMDDFQEIESFYDSLNTFEARIAKFAKGEAIPTALGNAIAYEDLSGKRYDPKLLYNNPLFNDFAHAIVPLTRSYLESNKSIDQEWVNQSVDLLKQALTDIRRFQPAVMTEVEIFLSNEAGMDRDWISYNLRQHFRRLYSVYDGVELTDVKDEGSLTKLIFIHHNHKSAYATIQEKLGNRFPNNLDLSQEYILMDKGQHAPIVVFIIKNSDRVGEIVGQFKDIDLSKVEGPIIYQK